MSVWDAYEDRVTVHGCSQRQSYLNREKHLIREKMKNSLAYHSVIIDGNKRDVTIDNCDNLNEKFIFALPGEELYIGGIVEWMENMWLITELDANTTVYYKAKMVQCNYLLKWVDNNGQICEQWAVVEDGTKYMTGEIEDRKFIVTKGDARIAIRLPANHNTNMMDRTTRFLIDDTIGFGDSNGDALAFGLTKPLKVGHTYNGHGIYAFVCSECQRTDDDNVELGIADYYKYYNKDGTRKVSEESKGGDVSDIEETNERKVWI